MGVKKALEVVTKLSKIIPHSPITWYEAGLALEALAEQDDEECTCYRMENLCECKKDTIEIPVEVATGWIKSRYSDFELATEIGKSLKAKGL